MAKGKKLRRILLAIAVVLVVVAAAVVVVSRGQQPLDDSVVLAGGKVRIVADDFIAAYLIELDDGGVALIDSTMDPYATAILEALRLNGNTSSQVRAIFMTHGHGDHIAGALAFPDADVYALEADADLVEGDRVAGNLPGKFREASPTGIKVASPLQDGDAVSIGGTEFEVFAVPGHTLGSAAYLVHGVLFLGDSAAARSDGKIAPAPPVFSTDQQANQQSLRQLAITLGDRGSDVDWLAFGHQGPLPGLDPLLEWAGQ